ncbi:MAG: hypothetical protein ACFB0B_15120 [Thermonemataceae bacterium]
MKKLNKFYKKDIKKGAMSEEEAREKLNKSLDIAVSIRYQDTSEFESELKGVKERAAIESLFEKVTLEE